MLDAAAAVVQVQTGGEHRKLSRSWLVACEAYRKSLPVIYNSHLCASGGDCVCMCATALHTSENTCSTGGSKSRLSEIKQSCSVLPLATPRHVLMYAQCG